MNNTIFYFLTIGIPVVAVIVVLATIGYCKRGSKCSPSTRSARSGTKRKSRSEVKKDNKQRVLELVNSKKKITNNQVEKLLDVSDATATRYLDELEKKGEIKQVGKTGKYTYYIKK